MPEYVLLLSFDVKLVELAYANHIVNVAASQVVANRYRDPP